MVIVDEDKADFLLVDALLEASAPGAYKVEWGPEYRDGLRLLRDSPPEAVLIDSSLGARSGLELIEVLCAHHARIPMILLTGRGNRRMEAAALAAGASDFLEKAGLTGAMLDRSLRYAIGRCRAAVDLERSEARFHAIVDHSTEGLALFDAHRRIIFQSPAVFAILGYAPAEMNGRQFDHFLRREDVVAHRATFAEALRSPGAVLETEIIARHKDGTWRSLNCSTVNRLHQPAVRAVVCNYRDVSRRRAAEEATQVAARRFRAVFEGARDGLVI
ncbi:MAG: PAS domain S-box protein, partial [Vicinamibacteraceae bacterium]